MMWGGSGGIWLHLFFLLWNKIAPFFPSLEQVIFFLVHRSGLRTGSELLHDIDLIFLNDYFNISISACLLWLSVARCCQQSWALGVARCWALMMKTTKPIHARREHSVEVEAHGTSFSFGNAVCIWLVIQPLSCWIIRNVYAFLFSFLLGYEDCRENSIRFCFNTGLRNVTLNVFSGKRYGFPILSLPCFCSFRKSNFWYLLDPMVSWGHSYSPLPISMLNKRIEIQRIIFSHWTGIVV